MEISDDVLCLFTADIEERNDSYVIEVPEREIDLGRIDAEDVVRVAVLGSEREGIHSTEDTDYESSPPVEEGEERIVEIENIGDQGDGIARVERGYVLIVPDTETGERVTVQITEVSENVAFAEVVNRHDFYE